MGYTLGYGVYQPTLLQLCSLDVVTGSFADKTFAYCMPHGSALVHGMLVQAAQMDYNNSTSDDYPLLRFIGASGATIFLTSGDMDIFPYIDGVVDDVVNDLLIWVPATSGYQRYLHRSAGWHDLAATHWLGASSNVSRVMHTTGSGVPGRIEVIVKQATGTAKDGGVDGLNIYVGITPLPPGVKSLTSGEINKYDRAFEKLVFGIGATADGNGLGGLSRAL